MCWPASWPPCFGGPPQQLKACLHFRARSLSPNAAPASLRTVPRAQTPNACMPACSAAGAAAVVAGIAAQYLQHHPAATSEEVKQALLQLGSKNAVAGVGSQSPNNVLAYSNITQEAVILPSQEPEVLMPPSQAGGGGDLSSGAIAGIAVAGAVGKRAAHYSAVRDLCTAAGVDGECCGKRFPGLPCIWHLLVGGHPWEPVWVGRLHAYQLQQL
jgi:hypothetical protein